MDSKKIEKHFDNVSATYDAGKEKYSYYYSSLKRLLRSLVPAQKRVFEFGCGTGDLLVSLRPKYGYGFDISRNMIEIAKNKHTNAHFSTKFPKEKFDYIFMSDVIEHLKSPQKVFTGISKLMKPETKFIITMANPLWEPLLMFWEKIGWKMEEGPHKRISFNEIKTICNKAGLKVVKHDFKLLMPIKILFITNFMNKYVEKYFKPLAFIEYLVIVKE